MARARVHHTKPRARPKRPFLREMNQPIPVPTSARLVTGAVKLSIESRTNHHGRCMQTFLPAEAMRLFFYMLIVLRSECANHPPRYKVPGAPGFGRLTRRQSCYTASRKWGDCLVDGQPSSARAELLLWRTI